MESPSVDVAVVGAGPGGLVAANRAAELGINVLLLEKQYEIGYPVRTSGGSYIKDITSSGVPARYLNPVRRLIFAGPTKEARFESKEDTSCVLDIRGAYQFLASEAARKGCQIEVGATVKGAIRGRGIEGVNVSKPGENFAVKSKVVIDASGLSAVIAQEQGLVSKTWDRFGTGAEYEAYVQDLEKDTAFLFVGQKLVPTGYGWIFPLSEHRARIGVGVTRPDTDVSPYQLLDSIVRRRPKFLEPLGRIVPIEVHAGNVPIAVAPTEFTADGLMIVGDAACQANPVVGEGIRIAMRFGKLAAEVAVNAIQQNDVSRTSFREYETEAKMLGRLNSLGLRVQRRGASYTDPEWDEAIEKLSELDVHEFISFLRGEFTKTNVLKLIAHHPRLASGTTFQLLRGMI